MKITKAEMLKVMNKAIFECTSAMSEKEITVLCKVRAFIDKSYQEPEPSRRIYLNCTDMSLKNKRVK